MIRLFNIEFYKIKHHKISKFLFFSYFVLLSSIALIASIKFKLGTMEIQLAEQGIFNFPYIWHFNTYIADIFTFFLAIIVVSMITNEYSYRTVKQNLIDGLSKKEFILSKFYFLVVLSLLATFFVFIISLILGYAYSDYTSAHNVFSDLYFLFAFFLKLLGTFSFIMFLGFLLKRSAFAIGFYFIWMAIEGITYGLMRWQVFNEKIADQFIVFLPFNAMKSLLPEPASRLSAVKKIGKQIGENMGEFTGISIYHFLVVIFWIVFFVYFSYAILKKRDL